MNDTTAQHPKEKTNERLVNMKGSADTHLPNDKYREGWERIFGKREEGVNRVERIEKMIGEGVKPNNKTLLLDFVACDKCGCSTKYIVRWSPPGSEISCFNCGERLIVPPARVKRCE